MWCSHGIFLAFWSGTMNIYIFQISMAKSNIPDFFCTFSSRYRFPKVIFGFISSKNPTNFPESSIETSEIFGFLKNLTFESNISKILDWNHKDATFFKSARRDQIFQNLTFFQKFSFSVTYTIFDNFFATFEN